MGHHRSCVPFDIENHKGGFGITEGRMSDEMREVSCWHYFAHLSGKILYGLMRELVYSNKRVIATWTCKFDIGRRQQWVQDISPLRHESDWAPAINLANVPGNILQSPKITLPKSDPHYSHLTNYSSMTTSLVLELGRTDSRQIKVAQPHKQGC